MNMSNLEKFKVFVKKNPSFANYVMYGSMTWQKFYELYDMYGEESSVWNEFKENKKKSVTFSDVVNLAKNIDVDKFQEGIGSLSKAVGLFSDLFANGNNNASTYQPRAIYRRFDD